MNIRSYRIFSTLLCPAALSPVAAVAQGPDVPTITVMTFRANEQGLGSRAADELRSHLADAFSSQDLYTVPTTDIQTNLQNSGFSIDDPLGPMEERQLAIMVRADMYITGKITHKIDDQYVFEPRLVLPHDPRIFQPLPVVERKDLGDVMDRTTRAIQEAIKQLPGTRKCEGLIQSKPADAIAAARSAVAAYPAAVIARQCMIRAYYVQMLGAKTAADSSATGDSILAASQAILQQDSLNVQALRYSAALYKVKGDTARELQSLLSLFRADSANAETRGQVIASLAGEHRVRAALPLLKSMLDNNPGDPNALRLAFQVYTTAEDWQSVADVGTQLVKADTTAIDSVYFTRMATAYDKLKQPQAATDILTQATARYPNNGYFWLYYANELQLSNQKQEAMDAYRRYISLGPKDQGYLLAAYLRLGSLYDSANAFDSLYSLVQRAAALPGLDTMARSSIATLALGYGNKLFQTTGAASPPPPPPELRNELQNSIKFLQLSNQISPSVNAQFLMGAANFQIMQSATEEAGTAKSCSLARLAQQSLNDAKPQLQAGMANPSFQTPAQNMLGYLPKFTPAIEQYIKKFCK